MISEINLNQNGVLIFENIPAGTEVGIDYHSWHVGPKFRGIVNIPPGFHFIFFSSVNKKHDQQSPRTGFFEFIDKGDVVIKAFDPETEDLKEDFQLSTEFSKQKYFDELPELVSCLAPYPLKECRKWFSLCHYVSERLLERVQPLCKKINVFTTVSLSIAGKQKSSIRNLDSRVEHTEDANILIRFTKIPSIFPTDISPQQKTKYSLDSSFFFETLIKDLTNGDDVLGELQFAFICFLLGQVYDAFEHWKLLVTLITNCQDSLSTQSNFFLKFIDLIDLQMEEIPEDYFIDIVAQNNFLLKTFQSFFKNFAYPDELNGELIRRVSVLKHKLTTRFEWNFDDDEDDDELPVIVEL